MPELPDVTVYVERLAAHVGGTRLERARLIHPFLLRTVEPPLSAVEGRRVRDVRRLGKRIVLGFESELFLVFHLMVTGRFRWRKRGVAVPRRAGLAAFDFERGALLLTEQGSRKKASLHVVAGEHALAAHDPGGLEVLDAPAAAFLEVLRRTNRTLKRALTDPRAFSGIGNAYSDEILWRARLSPLRRTRQLSDDEAARLHRAAVDTLRTWTERLRDETGEGFPEKVTAFREGMAVHGRFRRPCPACGAPVQRVVYSGTEFNYCARCQTGGRLLADRALSRLLGKDWPKSVEQG